MEQTLETLQAMLSRESHAYIVCDYFADLRHEQQENVAPTTTTRISHPQHHDAPAHVDSTCRYLMASWCNDLCDFCQYTRDMAAMAMINVDRYVATSSGFSTLLDRERYQLCVMTSFYMAAKITQTEALDPRSVADLSKGKMTKADIEAMERDMLAALKWCVNPPSAIAFATYMLDLLPAHATDVNTKEGLLDMTQFQIDAATCNYELCLHRPSRVAFGALLNAMESVDPTFALEFETTMLSRVLTAVDVTEIQIIRTGLLVVVSKKSGALGPWQELLAQHSCAGNGSVLHSKHGAAAKTAYPTTQKGTIGGTINISPRSTTMNIL